MLCCGGLGEGASLSSEFYGMYLEDFISLLLNMKPAAGRTGST